METRLIHHGSSGLFIGASKPLFALMNAAPAELLHFLDHAALQPIGYRLDKTAVLRRLRGGFIRGLAKKNAGNEAGVGILLQKGPPFFRRKHRLARLCQASR